MKLNKAQERRFKEVMCNNFTKGLLGVLIVGTVIPAICGNNLCIFMGFLLVLMLLKIAEIEYAQATDTPVEYLEPQKE